MNWYSNDPIFDTVLAIGFGFAAGGFLGSGFGGDFGASLGRGFGSSGFRGSAFFRRFGGGTIGAGRHGGIGGLDRFGAGRFFLQQLIGSFDQLGRTFWGQGF